MINNRYTIICKSTTRNLIESQSFIYFISFYAILNFECCRSHLIKCIKDHKLTAFPTRSRIAHEGKVFANQNVLESKEIISEKENPDMNLKDFPVLVEPVQESNSIRNIFIILSLINL